MNLSSVVIVLPFALSLIVMESNEEETTSWLGELDKAGYDLDTMNLYDSKVLEGFYKLVKAEDYAKQGRVFNFLLSKQAEQTKLRHGEKTFNLGHLEDITADDFWEDHGKGMPFTGRTTFVEEVSKAIQAELLSPATAPITEDKSNPLPQSSKSDLRNTKALVYSSVSGSGKTVSMLQLKARLRGTMKHAVTVAYLGFNAGLPLLDEEEAYINNGGQHAAKRILARRLAGATIISLNNPDEVTTLPQAEKVYKGYSIPSVDESKNLLLEFLDGQTIYIVAGVDEVQLLNQMPPVGNVGLGNCFLRLLREWQHYWYNDGIRLLPLGTGIAVDWSTDATNGVNVPICGNDATLISKDDFHYLVHRIVHGLNEIEFSNRFSTDTSRDTVTDLLAASYWPRVRLLEWWRDRPDDLVYLPRIDANATAWVTWLCTWLRDSSISVQQSASFPGRHDLDGKIICLFELRDDAQRFSVIPDGFTSSSLVETLKTELPAPRLYDGLDFFKSMDPKSFIPKDEHGFKDLGFHVIGAAVHVGIHALTQGGISSTNANEIQKKRLGLALWFTESGAMTHKDGVLLAPEVLGCFESTTNVGNFYPFESREQKSFTRTVKEALKLTANTHIPSYIRCGKDTCCDYLYFYRGNGGELICNIVVKHTDMLDDGQSHNASITTKNHTGLFKAALKVRLAVSSSQLSLGAIRLLFVTNRKSLAVSKIDSGPSKSLETVKQESQKIWPSVQLELLNKDSFDFGPFSDVLAARRKQGNK